MTRNGAILVVAAGLIVTSAGSAPSRPWPPPLVESTAVLTPEVSAALECVWTTPTLRRRVHAGSARADRKSTRLNSSHLVISYAVFCLKKKKMTLLTERHN